MLKRINHGWRLFGTVLRFSVFGIGDAILWFQVFPLLLLVFYERAQDESGPPQAMVAS